MLAGGTDALARLTFSGFNQLKLMDPAPCRPFDRTRAGMNIGEGAGILVLENLDRARRRGARIYAELAGYALGCEAYHPTAPEPEGRPVAAVIAAALQDAGLDAADVDHLNAHGTATPQNDAAEARAFRRIFGERVERVPVTSLKAMVGHCLGAAGAVEAAVLTLDRRPRRDSADDPPRRDRSRLCDRRRRQHRARTARPLRRVDVAGVRGKRLGARDPRSVSCGL